MQTTRMMASLWVAFPRPDEAYVQVYAGSFSWGHGHEDRGTWVMYAKGAPLRMDFAAMYTPSMRGNWLHPGGITFNHDETLRPAGEDPKDDGWRKGPNEQYRKAAKAPFTVVEMKPSPTSTAAIDRQDWNAVGELMKRVRANDGG